MNVLWNFQAVVSCVAAYLLGSVCSAVWIGKLFCHTDVREQGSHNAGTTNVMRVLGVKMGIPVLIIDVLKGFLAVALSRGFTDIEGAPIEGNALISIQILLGLLAVTGHMYPVFARFKGGKGVATLLGVVSAIHGPATLIALSVFIVVLLLSHYVSLSSILAGVAFPCAVIFLFHEQIPVLRVFSVAACLLLLFSHRKNIRRLIRHEEGKATFLFKEKQK